MKLMFASLCAGDAETSKTMGTGTPEQRLAQEKKKRAAEYEQQRKDEDEPNLL
jgi:hypothetical protein